jgi:hypothetical protein
VHHATVRPMAPVRRSMQSASQQSLCVISDKFVVTGRAAISREG